MAKLIQNNASSSVSTLPKAEVWFNIDVLNAVGSFEQVGGIPLTLTKELHRDLVEASQEGCLDELVIRVRVNDLRNRENEVPQGASRFAKKSDFKAAS